MSKTRTSTGIVGAVVHKQNSIVDQFTGKSSTKRKVGSKAHQALKENAEFHS